MRFIIAVFFSLAYCLPVFCQTDPIRNFSVKEGLPSGIVYDCLQDRDGFMWFATEAGLARFDGLNFKLFTTADGLTNNTILQIVEDIDGSIWIFPFGTSPCIYDFTTKKIINEKTNSTLLELGKHAAHLLAKKNIYGLDIGTTDATFIIEKRKIVTISYYTKPFYVSNKTLILAGDYLNQKGSSLFLYKRIDTGWVLHDSLVANSLQANKLLLTFHKKSSLNNIDWDNFKFVAADSTFFIHQIDHWEKPTFKLIKQAHVTGKINGVVKYDKFIYLCTTQGIFTISLTGELLGHTWPEYSFSKFYKDRQGNEWACTLDGSGVFMLLKNKSRNLDIGKAANKNKNITAIEIDEQHNLVSGDINGIINLTKFSANGSFATRHLDSLGSPIKDLQKISSNKVLGFTEKTIFTTGKACNLLVDMSTISMSLKSVLCYDSLFILGSSSGAFILNQNHVNITNFFNYKNAIIPHNLRTNCLAIGSNRLYLGRNTGLYQINNFTYCNNGLCEPRLLPITEPVTALSFSKDGLLWVGTNTNGLYVVRNDTVLANIFQPPFMHTQLGYIIKKIVAEPAKQRIWAATNKGVQLIDYKLVKGNFAYNTRFITTRDGLADNEVNDIGVTGDTVFAATIKGISYFPDTLGALTIPLIISGININNGKEIPYAASYFLSHSQNNIAINYTGICFTCDSKIDYEYRLIGNQRDSNWAATSSTKVEFGELPPGTYIFQVRTTSSAVRQIKIDIEAAFWQTKLFYIGLGLLIALLLFFVISWYIKRLQLKQVKQIALTKRFAELELQALQSQMNPHFIFNSMNSLQNFILTHDVENANDYLSKFSKLVRLFLDASRSKYISIRNEIVLINLYVELEQMRQIGSFNYTLLINEQLDLNCEIPSVIIQPFVENAIVHGIRLLEHRTGQLTIRMGMEETFFVCTIEDNGVGSKRAREIQQAKGKTYASYGTRIIQEKIDTLSKMEDTNITIVTTDSSHAAGIVAGTIVTIKMTLKPTV